MQLRWIPGLGVLVAACLVSACPRYARQPPQHVDASSTNKTHPTFAPAAETERPVRNALAQDPAPTCINGIIKTSGAHEIPVARANVTVARSATAVSQVTTDDNGHFSWCAPRATMGPIVRASVHVEKPAFGAIERVLDIAVGTTADLIIGLNPL